MYAGEALVRSYAASIEPYWKHSCLGELPEARLNCLLCILADKLKVPGEVSPSAVLLLAQLFPHHIEAHGLLDLVIVALYCRSVNRVLEDVCRIFFGYLVDEAEEKV